MLNKNGFWIKLVPMRLRCVACNFELNLPIKSLPQNTRLYCPKCKGVLGALDEIQNTPGGSSGTEAALSDIEGQSLNGSQHPSMDGPPPVKSPLPISDPQPPIQGPPSSVLPQPQQMFSEDLKPELEVEDREEVLYSKRAELFEQPSQGGYDSTSNPPPPAVVNLTPPPIPVVPPPIPMNAPPPIHPNSTAPASGYISASTSIQIDSSLVIPTSSAAHPPAEVLDVQAPVVKEERVEPAAEPRAEAAEKKDVILLRPQPYQYKKVSITLPVIGLILLVALTGFIYYQIAVGSSKSDIIKDLKTAPVLGAIPAVNDNTSKKPATATADIKEGSDSSKGRNFGIPIKAKRSALEHYKRGNRFFMETKYELARDEYAMAIAADPNFGLAYRGLGTTYAKLGQPDLAVKNYEKYIDLNPNATDAEHVKKIIKEYYRK